MQKNEFPAISFLPFKNLKHCSEAITYNMKKSLTKKQGIYHWKLVPQK